MLSSLSNAAETTRAGACRATIGLLAMLAPLTGCATLHRKPVSDSVVSARQLTREGSAAAESGRWEEAEQIFAQAIEKSPLVERAHAMYAEALWRRGATEKALKHMRESVRLSGGDPTRLVRLGELRLGLGDLTGASQDAEKAIAADPTLAAAYALRGEIAVRLGRDQDALTSFHRALNFQKHYPTVQMAVANVYRRQNRPLRALATLTSLRDQFPPDEAPADVLYLQGITQKDLGRNIEAVQTLRSCAAKAPQNPDVMLHLAEAQWRAGDWIGARYLADQALALNPRHHAGHQLKAQLDELYHRLATVPPSDFGARQQ